MKTTISFLFAILIMIYIAEPKIQFNPFKISFDAPYIPFAFLFMILSISFFGIHYSSKGRIKGYGEAYKLKLEQVESSYGITAYEEGFKDGKKSKCEELNQNQK